MKYFALVRDFDPNGISGIGLIAVGVELKNGEVLVVWVTKMSSRVHWDNINQVVQTHCKVGTTRLEWYSQYRQEIESMSLTDAAILIGESVNKMAQFVETFTNQKLNEVSEIMGKVSDGGLPGYQSEPEQGQGQEGV
jgi:hypothetical protein